MTGEPSAGLVDCWGGGGDLRKPQLRMLGTPLPRLCRPQESPGKAEGTGAVALGWWVSWEPPPQPPG